MSTFIKITNLKLINFSVTVTQLYHYMHEGMQCQCSEQERML